MRARSDGEWEETATKGLLYRELLLNYVLSQSLSTSVVIHAQP